MAAACTSSSSDFHPTEAEIHKVEKLLEENKCIGDLKGWRRSYVRLAIFSKEETEAARRENRLERLDNFDSNVLLLKLERSGGQTLATGRSIPARYDDFMAGECREPACLFGTYNASSDELLLDCENPPAP